MQIPSSPSSPQLGSQFLKAGASLIEGKKTSHAEFSSPGTLHFQGNYIGHMEMYADAASVAQYLDTHQEWFHRCAQPMTVESLGDNGYSLTVGKFVMVSSLCVSKIFHPLNLFWGILYWKQQAEYYLKVSGVPYTIIRPGGLKNEPTDEAIVMSSADTLFEGSIPREKVALVCVEALSEASAKNKVIEIVTSETATQQPISAMFASVG